MPAPLRLAAVAILAVGILTMGYAVVKSFRRHSTNGHGHVTVGSKDFTESILLAEIVAQMLEAQNVEVDRKFDLGGNLAHSAVVGGQIDLYPEYTGTAFTAILHHDPITDPKAVYDQVQREYSQQLNLSVSQPLGFDNTFAILVRGEDARQLNLKTISDAAKYSPQWQAGFGHDFINRQDGYPGFSKTYGLRFRKVSDMALDLTYTALASNKVDMIAGNSTDGRIASLDLVQLEDDKHYFPPYEAVFIVRIELLSASDAPNRPRGIGDLNQILNRLAGAISTDEMRKLNYEVDGARRDPKVVVREWLIKKGLVK
jgi:glycine betaine/choline ABC-type transport system substrate-binding protein